MEAKSGGSCLTPQMVNSQLASLDILNVSAIQAITQILDHCMPNVPSGFYILSLVLKHLQRLYSKNFDIDGNNDLYVLLCNLLKKCLHSVVNICNSEKFDILWNTFSQTLQKCAKGHKEVCNAAVKILSIPLLELTLSTSNTFSWQQKRDFLRLLRDMLSTADRMLNQKVGFSLDERLCKLTELFLRCGDYEYQASIMEVIFRYISIYRSRKSLKHWFNGHEAVYVAFSSIKFLEFDVDCRQFINIANESLGNNRQVYSFACLKAYLGETELQKPRDEKYKAFWIDFNKGSRTLSFYCEGNQLLEDSHNSKGSWKLIVIHKEMVKAAKLYKRNAVRSSRTGHCTVVIEFSKHDGNDACSSILPHSYLKFFFDHTYQLSLSKDVLLPLFEERFQELNSAKVTSYRSSVTPLVPVTVFRTTRNRDCNKRVKVSVGELMPVSNQKKFEPLIIKKSSKRQTKEASSAGSVQHDSLPFVQLQHNVSQINDELPDTQSSSDPVKDLKGKLTEHYIENFTKRKTSLAVSPQLSHVSEEKLTERGSASCSMESAQENNNPSINKPEKKLNKMSVSSQLCAIETKNREACLEGISDNLGEIFEPVKLDSERGFTSTHLKSPKVLLKKLRFNETSVSWQSHTDATKYTTHPIETISAYKGNRKQTQVEGAGLRFIESDSLSPTIKGSSNNLLKTNDCKDTSIKETSNDRASLSSYAVKDLDDLQNKLRISKSPKLESTINLTENKSLKPDDANPLSDLDMFFQDEISGKQNATPPNVHKLINTVGIATPIDSLEEQLRLLHNDYCAMQPGSSKNFKSVNVQEVDICNENFAVHPSDIGAPENSNISRLNLNLAAETQQTLIMVSSNKENETGVKKEQKNCSTAQFDNHQSTATEETEIKKTEIKKTEIPSQKILSLRAGVSPNEIATIITDESKIVKKSSVPVSKTSEALLADWEDNLDDGLSSKELYAAPCIKTSAQLNVQKLEINNLTDITGSGILNNLQSESNTIRKENCNDYPSEIARGPDERKSTRNYFKDFSSQKMEGHSKNILAESSKGESNKCTKENIVTCHLPIQGKKNYENGSETEYVKNNVTEVATVDSSFDISKVGKSNRLTKKRKLYTHSDSSTVISAQDFYDTNDTINDSSYNLMFARKKQRKSISALKKRDKRKSLAGGIFSLENSEDSAYNANEDKQISTNSFSQSFQLQFSMNKGYNRWYTKYKEECLQKYLNKQNKRSSKNCKETSVYSDIESEDSALSWLPPADEKKSKRRNEKLLEHLNRTARKYERKKSSSKKFKISSYSFTFANSKPTGNVQEATSSENTLKMRSDKFFFKNTNTSSLIQKCQDFDVTSEKLHGNTKATDSSSDDDKHLRNMPLSMRLSHDIALNETKHHKQLNNISKKDNIEKTNSFKELQIKPKKYGTTFPSSYSKNKPEANEGLSGRNEQAESFIGSNKYKQRISSQDDTKETYIQTVEFTNDKSCNERENFAIMEKTYCNDKDSTSSEASESIFVNKIQKKVKSYKTMQDLRPKSRALNAVDDLRPISSRSNEKTAKHEKKHSKDKPEVRSTFPNSGFQKITEKEKVILKKSAFPSSCSENKIEGTKGLGPENEQADSLNSRRDTKETFQIQGLINDESSSDKREIVVSMEEKYCSDKDDMSSETSESMFVNRIQQKVINKLQNYKKGQELRPKDQALNIAYDLQSTHGKKKHSKNKAKIRSTSPHSLSGGKITEEEGSGFNVLKSSFVTKKNEMKVKKKHPKKHPDFSDLESEYSSEEQENVKSKTKTILERNEGTKNFTSSKSACHISKELQNAHTVSSFKITTETSKPNGHKSQKKKDVLIYESANNGDAIASKQKYAYSNYLGHECLEDTTLNIGDDGDDLKSSLQTNVSKQMLDYMKSIHNISDDLQSDYYKSLTKNMMENSDNDGVMPRKNNPRGSKIVLQPQLKFSKSSQSLSNRSSENISKEAIDMSLDEQGAEQEILFSSGNGNKMRITSPTSKCISEESNFSHHQSSKSTETEKSPEYQKSAKNTSSQRSNKENVHENVETAIGSQDIFQHDENIDILPHDENIDSSDSEVFASKNKDRNVITPKFKKKTRHSSCIDIVKHSQGSQVKHTSQSPKQLSNISAVNSSFNYCFQDNNKTDKLLKLQDNRQENEEANFLKGFKSSVRIRQDPYFAQLIKKNDVNEKETSQYFSGAKDAGCTSQSSTDSSAKVTRSKRKEKLYPNQTTRNMNATVITTTGHSNHHDSSYDSTNSTAMLQEIMHNVALQSKDCDKNCYDLSQNSICSAKTRRNIHKTKRKPSKKHKVLKHKDDFGLEICLDVKANNRKNERHTAESSEEEDINAEPRRKLMFRQKRLKHEIKSDEFIITCTGDERAIAIEDGEGGVDVMVEKNADLKLSSLLPWEDMKNLLCKRTGNLESFITSATEATQDHFINTYKEISASRQMFLKNKLQRMENEITASEEVLMELNKQEDKFIKVFSYIEHAYQRQAAIEENLESRFSAQKNLFLSPKMALQQKDEQNVLQKHTESLQKDLTEMQNHYYKEECNEIRKTLQQRLMVSFRMEDMDA